MRKNFFLKLPLHHNNNNITQLDIIIFLRQLATLIKAGIPIVLCYEILEKSQTKNNLRILIFSIKQALLSGKDLSTSFRLYANYFDELTCMLVNMGEHTGNLDTILHMLATSKEKQWTFKKTH